MAITSDDLKSIEQLAYLDAEPSENTKLAEEINAIMDFVEQLKQVDTTGVAPLFHPFDLHQRLRPDEVQEQDCSRQLEEIAPLFEENLYLVPKIIESGQ
ncbi:Asp-tRNA(Asn)/Glu-tRNA(Gln) amidotransferase subunit GatC [Legionella jamestowniensis]|uniref:Aspartyl/glutamyl-tRNA(Asn/Gln) amidotransferase subunit C n=1 Tax=Legionella jamestowniensis TaxID=455 RepID=A0A0W0UJL2_9GAMM|nr:Asp-tRNA(Asn)/Glu-tRNA(Gln) amidotransferase subunit GatC [Legionella jamestowniensis]KTD08096.1 glutamyl/tRNA (Gln) amidotransferase subunit C [Legionella jamestowniensis]OCH97518.1 glutamyl-tRNA amidotransferase [Legionella jamestowniensis]SFM09290.1 aspartyl/glutamyl-tRNA(Asn/Gln) amidotransferase subunit C [Legionella jamestowniensis DSM 19215]